MMIVDDGDWNDDNYNDDHGWAIICWHVIVIIKVMMIIYDNDHDYIDDDYDENWMMNSHRSCCFFCTHPFSFLCTHAWIFEYDVTILDPFCYISFFDNIYVWSA